MVRRKFLRYTRAEHLDEEGIQRYIRFLPPDELYHHLERFPRLDAISLFGNECPLEMEIGCGSAEPLCALARAHPERAYVGIDISGPSIHKAAENAAKLNLENILFLNADMHLLYPLLAPQAVQAVYLHFPDPHAKYGYKKRRIFGKHFLDAMAYTLPVGGILSVMTDHQELFLDMLTVLEADARFAKAHPERYLLNFEDGVKSHFQRIWEQHGERVFRFVAYLLPASVEEEKIKQTEKKG